MPGVQLAGVTLGGIGAAAVGLVAFGVAGGKTNDLQEQRRSPGAAALPLLVPTGRVGRGRARPAERASGPRVRRRVRGRGALGAAAGYVLGSMVEHVLGDRAPDKVQLIVCSALSGILIGYQALGGGPKQ